MYSKLRKEIVGRPTHIQRTLRLGDLPLYVTREFIGYLEWAAATRLTESDAALLDTTARTVEAANREHGKTLEYGKRELTRITEKTFAITPRGVMANRRAAARTATHSRCYPTREPRDCTIQ